MVRRHKRSKKQIISFITQYGIHIWAILIIANAVMVYTYQFATHAQDKSDNKLTTLSISQSPTPSLSPSPSIPSAAPSTAPLGPTIQLSFSVPGIGSGGGNMKPLHPKRNVMIYLYAPAANSQVNSVKPLYTIQTTAAFDTNPYSPTYTSFVIPFLDLGSNVKDGNYQIAFRTDLSLHTLIKQNPTDPGGEVFPLTKGTPTTIIPPQTVLMGDTVPAQGDNAINVSDYNAFISCFGDKNNTNSFCKTGNYGDFNDDGVIDGIDYNILLRSLFALSQEGLPIPKISSPTPTTFPVKITQIVSHVTIPPKPTKKVIPVATLAVAKKNQTSAKKGSALGVILFIFFLIILGVIGFLVYKKRDMIKALIHQSPTGTPEAPTSEVTEEQAADTTEQTPEAAQPAETPTQQTEEASSQPVAPAQPAEQAPSTAPAPQGDIIEKECYVKKKGPDEAGTGQWLLLTDDTGPIQAHYSKNDAQDGFAKAKGVMKTENGKTFMEITELTPEG